jgi:putative membrane protein
MNEEESPGEDVATRLAYQRTFVAVERTVLAWCRTALALITFGFSLYKVSAFRPPALDGGDQTLGPRAFAILLISLGIASLVVAIVAYAEMLRALRVRRPGSPPSLSIVLAACLAVLGSIALAATLLRE